MFVCPQSCLTLCDPKDCSPPGFSVHGILPARILERVAISFSRGSSWPRDRTPVLCLSCTGRHILYHNATRKLLYTISVYVYTHTHKLCCYIICIHSIHHTHIYIYIYIYIYIWPTIIQSCCFSITTQNLNHAKGFESNHIFHIE